MGSGRLSVFDDASISIMNVQSWIKLKTVDARLSNNDVLKMSKYSPAYRNRDSDNYQCHQVPARL